VLRPLQGCPNSRSCESGIRRAGAQVVRKARSKAAGRGGGAAPKKGEEVGARNYVQQYRHPAAFTTVCMASREAASQALRSPLVVDMCKSSTGRVG
jgi:hypothetical protein